MTLSATRPSASLIELDEKSILDSELTLERPNRLRSLGRRPQLDGLRGLAWLGVFVGHASLSPIKGVGDVAMYLFFGLSGFLITTVLSEEFVRKGSISLRKFFARRALRLLPALVAFLAIWLVVDATLGSHKWLTTVPGGGSGAGVTFGVALQGAGVAVAYVTNWFSVFHMFSGYVPLGHLWSLAVEEQAYLIWAPLLALLLLWRRRAAVVAAIVLVTASIIETFILRSAHQGLWAYMGTDTRSGAFLLGGAISLVWSSGGFRWLQRRWLTSAVTVGSVATLLLCAVPLARGKSIAGFDIAWVAATAAGPVLVLSVIEGSGFVLQAFSHKVIAYLGRRSYALYLWHYVFLTWLRQAGLFGVAVALLSTLVVAELSWRLIETPALRMKERLFS